jgi:hypothetical protein
MTERIGWVPTQYGGYTGHVGTLEPWLFQIWHPEPGKNHIWQLDTALPGMQFTRSGVRSGGVPTLKAEAEKWLAEFVASLGAEFKHPVIAVPGADDSKED